MAIEKELLDRLPAGRDPQELFAKDGLLDDLKAPLGRILNAELDDHLDDEQAEGPGEPAQRTFEDDGSDGHVEARAFDPA